MRFEKTALTIDEQISLLKERGMMILDNSKAKLFLSNISYYRLSAYWYTFLKQPQTDHLFIKGATFDKALDTYVFDRKLRLLIFDEIERIEIALRSTISYNYCLVYGNNWYENKDLFKDKNDYFEKFTSILNKELGKTSEIFIKHYTSKYNEPINPPSWMTLELISFGQLSTLFKNLKNCDARKNVAKHFGIDEHILESWLEALSYVRNACAHHMRFWNRKLPRPIILPRNVKNTWLKELPQPDKINRAYAILSAINYLLSEVSPDNSFSKKINELFNKYPLIPKHYMGFTTNWKQEQIWKY